MTTSHPPESTYRLQFHKGFTFRDATAIVPYLASLGVTHLYASPYLKAVPGSTHGYDVIDPCQLNPEIGTPGDYDALLSTIHRHGMAHILDIVPNHMGVGTNENSWWNSVLEQGEKSPHADVFDIAWDDPARPSMAGKVLLPILGEPYGQVLGKGQLQLSRGDDGIVYIKYYDRRFPIDPATAGSCDIDALNRSAKDLHELLEKQHYRLAYWRTASDEINYRRFFNIDALAALCMERQSVFDATHKFIFELVNSGKVAGLRIDHPDGLYNPREYLQRLQKTYTGKPPLYVVVEKILAEGEPLPNDWPVAGTSGYDFLIAVNGIYVDRDNADHFTAIYDNFIGDDTPFEELVHRNKKRMIEESFEGDLNALTRIADAIAQGSLDTRDFTFHQLHDGLAEMIACFSVYRTYIESAEVSPRDCQQIEAATSAAQIRAPHLQPEVLHFLRDALLQRKVGADDPQMRLKFAGRFQQLTSPVTAKGIEDTSFYQYHRLISLNEVGGEPGQFGSSPENLHEYLRDRQQTFPRALSPLSTHDTKRSEDVRARINALSELPDDWRVCLADVADLAYGFRTPVSGELAPGRTELVLILQTLLGAWPIEPAADGEMAAFVDRVQAYLLKALREAKQQTSWTNPNSNYESAVKQYVDQLMALEQFHTVIAPLRNRVTELGLINSISQTVVRLSAPGAPDTYQGTELWDFSLVDPDNRRPVDYDLRRRLLDSLDFNGDRASTAVELYQHRRDGRIKLWITALLLRARREHRGLFSGGDYLPVQATGPHAQRVFSFARITATAAAIVVTSRLVAPLCGSIETPATGEVWADTRLNLPERFAHGKLRDLFTGRLIETEENGRDILLKLDQALANLPVAVLVEGS